VLDDAHDNVTPLRPPIREELEPRELRGAGTSTAGIEHADGEFISPYDDEFEVPAFIRRARHSELG
jgi:hypothetical protein